jgi:hypothetical protein
MGGFKVEAAECQAEAGGGPSRPLTSAAEICGAFEVTTTQVEVSPSSLKKRKSFVFKQKEKFLWTLVFP